MAIYAKLYSYTNGAGVPAVGIQAQATQPDASWTAYDVPDVSWLSIVNGAIVAATLVQVQAKQLTELQIAQCAALKASCDAAIVGGYSSTALGAAHTYPSTQTDQINMLGSVSASVLPGLPATWTTVFWCADSTGAWAMRPHTAAQIQQAGSDGKAWVTTCQVKLATLVGEVMAATTPVAVLEVVW